jgi:hypothetical protein
MSWQSTIEFLGGATAISLTLAFLGRKAIDAFVTGRVEAYRIELQRIAGEHSVRFQRLHAERAEVVKDFYGKFVILDETLHSTLRSFQVVGEEPLPDKVKRLGDQFNEIRNYFLPRRIFFDESICKLIDDALDLAKGIFFDITVLEVDPQHVEYKYNREVLKERHVFWEKARAKHKSEFSELKKRLEGEFRAILGLTA